VNDSDNQPKSKQKHELNRKWLTILVCIVLLILGVVGGWMYNAIQQSIVDDKAVKQATERTAKVNKTENDAQILVEKSGDIKGAELIYDNAIRAAGTDSDLKYRLLMNKATLYFNNGDYQKALVTARQAEVVIKNSNVEQFLAQIYEAMGDKQNAIKYYDLAISLLDKSSPMADSDKNYYQSKISELGG